MALLRLYYHVVRADLLERTRRYSFLVSLLIIIYLGYAVNTGLISFVTAGAYSVMNSAWIGLQMALVVSTTVSLIGFYLVKNCIERDEVTGVGQIIATTPVTRLQYLLGKWLSNLIVLTLVLLILCAAAVIMQALQVEAGPPDFWALLSPILIICLPAMSLTAALAVLFESLPQVRGSIGNLLYFIVCAFLLIGGTSLLGEFFPAYEPFGLGLAINKITPAIQAIAPGYTFRGAFFIGHAAGQAARAMSGQPFVWSGIDWTADILLARAVVFAVPLLLVGLAAAWFRRFDPAHEDGRNLRSGDVHLHSGEGPRSTGEGLQPKEPQPQPARAPAAPIAGYRPGPLRGPLALTVLPYRPSFAGLVGQNLRLMVKGFPEWYYLALAALWVGCLLGPASAASPWLSALSLLVTVIWSRAGAREGTHHTGELTFSAPHPLGRLLLAEWVAACLLTVLVFGGLILNLTWNGNLTGLMGLGLGILLLTSAALALGAWSGSSKPFEAGYLIAWYLGTANSAPWLDYLGTTPAAFVHRSPLLALGLAAAFLATAFVGRKRQMV